MYLAHEFNKYKDRVKAGVAGGVENVRGTFVNSSNIQKISDDISRTFSHYVDVSSHFMGINQSDNALSVGIDITPHCIYLCEIDAQGGKRVLTSMASVCMEGKFVTEDIRSNVDQYISSLKTLIKENNIQNKNVALCLPVASSIVRTARVPYMDRDEIEKAIKYGSLWENFMHPDKKPDDYSVFYQVVKANKKQQTMEILFVATKLSDVELYTDIVKESGLNPVVADVRCFAINNALSGGAGKNQASVFVEFNLEESYAMISCNGSARVYDIVISDTDRIPLIESIAEEKKVKKFSKKISVQISNIIKSYKISNAEAEVKEVYVISQMPAAGRVIKSMQSIMKDVEVSECRLFNCIDIDEGFTIDKESAKVNLSAWAGAISSALGLSKKVKSNDNKRKVWVANLTSIAASVVLGVLGLTINSEFSSQRDALDSELAKMNGVESSYNRMSVKHKTLSQNYSDVLNVNEIVLGIRNSKERLSMVHDYLNLVILDGIWLKELRFTAPDKIEIYGGASEDGGIVEFIQLLNEGSQFSNVALKSMKETREMDWGSRDSVRVKNFSISGSITNTPIFVDESANMLAGDINQGG